MWIVKKLRIIKISNPYSKSKLWLWVIQVVTVITLIVCFYLNSLIYIYSLHFFVTMITLLLCLWGFMYYTLCNILSSFLFTENTQFLRTKLISHFAASKFTYHKIVLDIFIKTCTNVCRRLPRRASLSAVNMYEHDCNHMWKYM